MDVPKRAPGRLTEALSSVPKARGTGRSGPRRRTGCLTCRARKPPSPTARLEALVRPIPHPQQAAPQPASSSPAGSSASAVAGDPGQRSPDVNFFSTVLRSDDHHRTNPAPATDSETYPPELGGAFDMLKFMGGITADLEQKHVDLTSGLANFHTSATPQSVPAVVPNTNVEEDQLARGTRSPFSSDAPSSVADGGSAGSTSDATTLRRSWSGSGNGSYEDQLLQYFLAIDPPAGIFAPVTMEWKYVVPTVLAYARTFSPLLNAIYCYADIHKSVAEGKRWRWAPTYHQVSSSEIQKYLLGDVAEPRLIKIFATVFFLMLSELFSSSDLCALGTSYLRTSYLLLQRFHARTQAWTGFGHLMVSWVSLLDVKALIAGREGDTLDDLANPPALKESATPRPVPAKNKDDELEGAEDQFQSPSYLIYEALVGPAFRFFVQAQQNVRRIVSIDLHHRSRGTLSDEFEVLQIAHKVGADLEALWHTRPAVIDIYEHPDALTDTLRGPVALEVCRTFRQYIASFLANFIYLHRVAFAIYPRTDRVEEAVDKIVELATAESVETEQEHLRISFLWPLFMAGLEGSSEQRRWILQEMQRMAVAPRENEPASITRHPSADKVLLLLEEMIRRQDTSRAWADSKFVRKELFADFFILI
ncbi:hypothetical protein N7470_008771 [Penicillium chermesinum]|nr:hypothetical protein N7470_008771 [Penicillium chermesinum]